MSRFDFPTLYQTKSPKRNQINNLGLFNSQNLGLIFCIFQVPNEKEKEGLYFYLLGINSDPKCGVKGSGNGSFGGVLGAIGDVADRIADDADARDGAVDLEAGLEVEDGAVGWEAHDYQRRRRGWLGDWFIGLDFHRRRLGKRTTPFDHGGGDVAGEVGFVSLPAHGLSSFLGKLNFGWKMWLINMESEFSSASSCS